MRQRFILYILLCGIMPWLYAQNPAAPVKMLNHRQLDNADVLRQFEVRFLQMDSLMKGAHHIRFVPPCLEEKTDSASLNVLDSLYRAKTESEIAAFKRRNGLELTGQIYQRLDNTLGLDEDDQYSRYSTKFQSELGWNFFNSSLLQRKDHLRQIRLANELENLRNAKKLTTEQWGEWEEFIRMKYNRLISIVLYNRLVNTDILNTAYQYALEQDKIANNKLLDVMNDKMDIEYALLQICPVDSVREAPLVLPVPTVMVLDSARLFTGLDNNPDIRASYVQEDLLEAKSKVTNYVHGMRFTPFVRMSNYLRPPLSSSTNVDLGVRFTFPLFDESAKKRRALRTEQAIVALNREAVADDVKDACRPLLRRFERLNATILAEKNHLEQMTRFIGLRRLAYENSQGGYSYIDRMEEYNGYLKSVERLYRLMLSRDLCLLDIWVKAGHVEMPAIINHPINAE